MKLSEIEGALRAARLTPQGAFALGAYDVPACARHLGALPQPDCMDTGGLARHACPAGRDFRHAPPQARFHMHASLCSNGDASA